MDDEIRISFGSEHEWEENHRKLVDGLIAIGALFGDDESLMRAKADCVYRIVRQIVDDVPKVKISTKVPDDLPPDQLEYVNALVQQAALHGIETAMLHSVEVLMNSIYDLCTSKLARQHYLS